MRRRWKLILFAIVLPLSLIGGCGVLAARKFRPKPEVPKTAKVERGDVVVAVVETGRVEPMKWVAVKSKVAGQLDLLAVDEGDRVEKGQLIARLNVQEAEAQRDQIKAQLAGAQAGLEQARLSSDLSRQLIESQIEQAQASLAATKVAADEAETRARDAERIYTNQLRLFEMGGFVSQTVVDSAKAAMDLAAQQRRSVAEQVRAQEAAAAIAEARRAECKVAESRVVGSEASVRQVQDSLTEIEVRLQDAVIRAPCPGTVITRHIREGEMISAVSAYGDGSPIITIGDLSTMLVKVDLNEVDVHDISVGQQVELTVDALRDQSFEGEVTQISPGSIASAGGYQAGQTGIVRFPIEITVTGSAEGLMPGMTANAEIQCQRVDDVLWVPSDAIFKKEGEEGKSFVSVVTGEEGKSSPSADTAEKKGESSQSADTGEKKGKSFLSGLKGGKTGEQVTEDREVTLGLANDSRTEIKSGLEEGDEVQLGKSAIPERKIIDMGKMSEDHEGNGG
jgi:HlyD family secretion protein